MQFMGYKESDTTEQLNWTGLIKGKTWKSDCKIILKRRHSYTVIEMAYIFHVCVNSLTENVIFENANIFNVLKM